MYSIKKKFKFEVAHRLLSMPDGHPCRGLHGHSYVVHAKVSVEDLADLPNPNMLIDFGKLKEFQRWLDENFDHATVLNFNDPLYSILKQIPDNKVRIMPSGDPTAENMASFFCLVVGDIVKKNISKKFEVEVEVFETEGNSASYKMKFDV